MLKTSNYRNLIFIARAVLLVLFCLLVFWLIKQDIAFSGVFKTAHDYSSPSPFFTELVPKQRVVFGGEGSQFIDEPVYTTLKYPRPFQELALDIEFKNPDNLFVEFGPQVGLPETYGLQALNHPLLNDLLQSTEEWDKVDEALYQKRYTEYRYDSLDQFTNALPPMQSVGYYGVEWEKPYQPDFSRSLKPTDITTPLSGSHQFYLASNQLVIDVSLAIQDINTTKGADGIVLEIQNWNGDILKNCSMGDDGEEREKGITTDRRILSCEVSLNEPQVLILNVNTTNDIIIHRLQSSAPYIVAKDRLHLAGGPEYSSEFGNDLISTVEVVTSARTWSATTMHRSTLQTIRLSREQLQIEEPYKSENYQMPSDQRFLLEKGYSFFTEKGNLIINGRGVFALPGSNYFSPKPWLIDSTTDPQVIGITYLQTNYTPPREQENGDFEQRVMVDLSEVFAPSKALRFQWSLPKMKEKTNFVLKELRATYTSDPITASNIKEKFLRFIEREF